MKTAFLFPGQGSQYVGMGKALFENSESARRIFATADQVLGFSISKLCFEGPEDELKRTENAQPALLTVSYAAFVAAKECGIEPDGMAGHSLGEYTALAASGAITFEDALRLVRERGRLMGEAGKATNGGMAAVLSVPKETLSEWIQKTCPGLVELANLNSPGQIVVSGKKEGLDKLAAVVSENKGRFIPLAVSGAFHSSLMQPAAEAYKAVVFSVKFSMPNPLVVANVTAGPIIDASVIPQQLVKHIVSPVRWEETLRYFESEGYTHYIEIGPGKVLSGLVKKTVQSAVIAQVEEVEAAKKVLAILKEV
ncbi:MAG TPA: ACP S-malonyltransferase [Bacillota bacterium]|nr:ACP S-malonyltransferase [Bacillota bacterium]